MKRPLKEEILIAKRNRTYVSPNNKEYSFDFKKEGRKYIYIVIYKDSKMQMNESDFNRINIDDILNTIENGLLIN
jgi:hypothetical protein